MEPPTLVDAHIRPTNDRFFRTARSLLAPLAFVLMTPALAQEATLTEETAVRLGLSRPAVESLLSGRLDAARGDFVGAGRQANPAFQYEREGLDGIGGNGTENFYRLSQTVDFSGQRAYERKAARTRLDAAGFDAESYRRDLAADIRRRFYALLLGRRLEAAAGDWAGELDRLDDILARRAAAGDVSAYDRRRMAQERMDGPVLLAEIRADIAAARETLAALIGKDALARYGAVGGRLLPPVPLPLEQLLAELDNRPDLQSLERQAEAQDLERQAARRSAVPDVTVGVGLRTVEDPLRGDQTGVLVSATVPLPVMNRGQGERLSRSGRAQAMRAEYRIARDRAAAALAATHARVRELRSAAADYRSEAAAPADELKAIAEAAYEAGEVGVLELLDAFRNAFEVQRRALELEMRARRAQIELIRLSGGSRP